MENIKRNTPIVILCRSHLIFTLVVFCIIVLAKLKAVLLRASRVQCLSLTPSTKTYNTLLRRISIQDVVAE